MRYHPCTGGRIVQAVDHRSPPSSLSRKGSVQVNASAGTSDMKSMEYCKSLTMMERRENSRGCDVRW
jgi:hypothetical protein